MDKILKIYNYSNVDIIRVSISEPKFSERYRYYYNYIRKVKNYSCGDMRLNYPETIKRKWSTIFNSIKELLGFNIQYSDDKYIEETYRNVLVFSCYRKDNEWIFNDSSAFIYREDENFFINDEKYLYFNQEYNNLDRRIIFRFHNTDPDNINSDTDGNTWLDLDEIYKIKITKRDNDTKEETTDIIYFTDKEEVEKFLEWIQKYISKEENLIVDGMGKIIKK